MLTPMLRPTCTSVPATRNGVSSTLRTLLSMAATTSSARGTIVSPLSSSRSGTSTRNSSPPWRATMSVARVTDFSRVPKSRSSSSPASCPKLSLISLKLSRSMNSTATPKWWRSARASASARCSWNIARLGRPVQLVVVGQVLDLGLGTHLLGDVAGDRRHRHDRAAVVDDRRDGQRDVDGASRPCGRARCRAGRSARPAPPVTARSVISSLPVDRRQHCPRPGPPTSSAV